MSQRTISMTVVNASGSPINGTAYHWSGDGSNHIASPSPALAVNLAPFGPTDAVASNDIEVRSNHDDYWFWQPQNADGPIRCRKNCDGGTVGVCLVVTDTELVVVTSNNGVATQNLPASQAAATHSART